jgi:tetratricopeptide (TPR) repeat protein
MKLFTTTAIALAAGLIATPAAAQMGQNRTADYTQQTAAQPQVPATENAKDQKNQIEPSSDRVRKAIVDLQTAVNAKDYASLPAKVAAARAIAKTPGDHYLIALMQYKAAGGNGDKAQEAEAIEDLLSTGKVPASQVSPLTLQLAQTYLDLKQNDKAATTLERAVSMDPGNVDAMLVLAQIRHSEGKAADAIAGLQKAIAASNGAGRKPDEKLYQAVVQYSYDAKLPAATQAAREWVAAYPSANSWRNALVVYRNLNSSADALDVMRLARATDSMKGTGDYNIYAAETINSQNYGEAKSLIAEGLASGKIQASDPVIQDIQKALTGKAAPTTAELASREAGAKAPTAFLRVGDAYYGAGNYQKAAELYREAVDKGADANLANLRLGEALARAGDKPGATAALGKVGGSLTDIAKFWLVYVQHG